MSTSSMLHHFGSREQLLVVAASWTGRARLREMERRSPLEGALAFLPAPADDEDLITTRAWLAWCELWRSEDGLIETVARIRDEEHVLLARVLGMRLDSPDVVPVTALIEGLRVGVSAPVRPLPPVRARELLAAHLASNTALNQQEAG